MTALKELIKKPATLVLISLITVSGAVLAYILINSSKFKEKAEGNGTEEDEVEIKEFLRKDTTWSGEVYLQESVTVQGGATLTIEPGTVVKFGYGRDYKEGIGGAGLRAEGGTIIAKGTPDNQIWFTSAAEEPINGDWQGIAISNSNDSEFSYVIVEYGEMGIEQFDSSVAVKNSIIRWSNAEGLYAERSEPYFENNTLYGNGYHDIALEQYNENVQILNNKFLGSRYSIHHEETESRIEGNYFYNILEEVITAGMESEVLVIGNKFENCDRERAIVYDGHAGVTLTERDNDFGDGSVDIPVFDYEDIKKTELTYLPGDEEDKYPYIYDEEDETRKTIKKVDGGVGFGWSLEYVDGYLWAFDANQLNKIDPKTGEYEQFSGDPEEIMNPRGLTWDGEYLWINDFSLLKVIKLQVASDRVEVLESFDIPNKEDGGANGLTTDGEYLYLRTRNGGVAKLDKEGNLIKRMHIRGGPLVWTGEYFWTAGGCEKGICKYTEDGELVGEIYFPAKDPWAITWDGEYLWTRQRTCEMWDDPKLYKIEILDDSPSE